MTTAFAIPTYTNPTKGSTMNNTINIGDVFEAAINGTSFAKLEVLGRTTNGYGQTRYRCLGTRRDGTTAISPTVTPATLGGFRYRKVSTRDFNVNTESYPRPMSGGVPALDVPAVSTALIRDTVTVPRFLGDTTSTLLHVAADGNVRQAKGRDAKVQLLINATDGLMMLAVPGKYSQDVFFVDSREVALEALGFKRGTPIKSVTDALGNTWVAA